MNPPSVESPRIQGNGLVVIAATDGLFDPIRIAKCGHRGRFSADPDDNSIGGLDPKMCRARGLGAHTLAALAAAIAHNLKLAKSDPDADNGNKSDDPSDGNAQSDDNPPDDEADTDVPPSRATDNGNKHTPRPPP